MIRPPRLPRRSVLALLAGAAVAPSAGIAAAASPEAHLEAICRRVRHHPDLLAWGRRYLEHRADGATAATLRAELLAALPAAAPHEAALVEALRLQAMADFRDGRIIALDGWRISLTEARLCGAGAAKQAPAA